MSKQGFFWFAVVVAVFAVALPVWAINKDGSEDASPAAVAPEQEEAKELFVVNCGACHTLAKAGTDGVVGPNLDELLGATPDPEANVPRVESAVLEGRGGRMPAGILQGANATEVSEFVAAVAGQ
jgi:mono/diheme cytochrome c family protein